MTDSENPKDGAADTGVVFDTVQVMEKIPHRYPFLMVDRVIELVHLEKIVALKAVTIAEPHFQGHFPGHPVMPGVLIVESMAQAAGLMVLAGHGKEAEGKVVYLMAVEEAKFRRPVVPGDMLRLDVSVRQRRGKVWKFTGVASVGGKTVAEAVFTATIRNA